MNEPQRSIRDHAEAWLALPPDERLRRTARRLVLDFGFLGDMPVRKVTEGDVRMFTELDAEVAKSRRNRDGH